MLRPKSDSTRLIAASRCHGTPHPDSRAARSMVARWSAMSVGTNSRQSNGASTSSAPALQASPAAHASGEELLAESVLADAASLTPWTSVVGCDPGRVVGAPAGSEPTVGGGGVRVGVAARVGPAVALAVLLDDAGATPGAGVEASVGCGTALGESAIPGARAGGGMVGDGVGAACAVAGRPALSTNQASNNRRILASLASPAPSRPRHNSRKIGTKRFDPVVCMVK
jgi:hypothetical protein